MRDAKEIHEDPPASVGAQERRDGRKVCDRRASRAGRVQIPREERHGGGRDRHVTRAHFAVEQALGDDRADADANGKERQHHRHHLLVREKNVFGERRQSGHDGGAKEPEPRHRENRQQQRRTRRHVPDDGDRVAQKAGPRRIERGGRRRRDLARRKPAEESAEDAATADDERTVAEEDHAAAENRPQEDRQERSCLDEGIAGDQFIVAQVLRKQGVFDRAKDSRVRAEAEEGREEQRDAAQPEAHRAKGHDGDFGELHEAGDERLVDAIGERARGTREEKERRDEDRAGQHDERGGAKSRFCRQAERHDDAHGALQQVVVEGAEELRHKERCKTTSRQELDERRAHDKSPRRKSRRPRPR